MKKIQGQVEVVLQLTLLWNLFRLQRLTQCKGKLSQKVLVQERYEF